MQIKKLYEIFMAKIVIIAGFAQSLVNFRGDLIREMVAAGQEVVAIAPESESVYVPIMKRMGAQYCSVFLQRTGMNPFADIFACINLIRLLKRIKPDIVLSYTIKPVIFGSLSARVAGVRQINSMITGLGYAFTGESIGQKILAGLCSLLYRMAISCNQQVFFQNPDDLKAFIDAKIIPDSNKTLIINGSGVNIDHYYVSQHRIEPVSFLLIARLLRDKGVREYVAAAKIIKKQYPTVSFKLVGPLDSNPQAISRQEVTAWESDGTIIYLGETSDVRPFISDCSVYVLPSYREGTPRSVLEAMSMGKPVVTTDAPGCRETVFDGVNGFLVPVKDVQSLAAAMERFILDRELIAKMGDNSRTIAVEKYDVHKVNEVIMKAMGVFTL